jgi:hypothetical protein
VRRVVVTLLLDILPADIRSEVVGTPVAEVTREAAATVVAIARA